MATARRKNKPVNLLAPANFQVSESLTLTRKQHDDIIKACMGRLDDANRVRDARLDTFRAIDQEYYSWMLHDADDKQRDTDNRKGKGIKPTDQKLSLIFSQIDEAVTYLLSLLAPDEGMYSAQAPKEEQPIADGLAALMNQHAKAYGHYRNYAIFLLCALKYNLGAFGVEWKEVKGQVFKKSTAGASEQQQQVVQVGNDITVFDPYNLLLDPSVIPVDMAREGEFFAHIKLATKFRIKKMAAEGKLFNVDRFLDIAPTYDFYREHPNVMRDAMQSGETNWFSILTAGHREEGVGSGYEIIPSYFWIKPSDFNLPGDDFEIWNFIFGGNKHILYAAPQKNAHGLLPINVAVPYEDNFGIQTKSVADRLIGYQNFASFSLNVHQRATRKKLYGTTFYDAAVFPSLNTNDSDMAGGKVPAETQNKDIDLNKRVVQFNDGPDTSRTLENIAAMNDVMQDILPTQIARQVAGLDRATQYQAAATVQGANRRNLKIGRIIESQSMESGRTMQLYNIMQFQTIVTVIDQNGDLQQIDPANFRDKQLEFKVSDGLKGLDRLATQINMKELIAMVLQSSQASSQTDVMALLNYLSTLFGDHTDFNQFKLKSPMDALPPEQRTLAYQLLQEALQKAEESGNEAETSALPQVTR